MSKCLKTTILISSGWRTKEENDEANGHPNSYHLKGLAADVHEPPSRNKLRKAAKECGFYVLAKKYPNRIHVDLRGGRKPKVTPNEHICKKIREGK